MQTPDPVRAMYETLPFPRRREDHVDYAHFLVQHLVKHGVPLRGKWLDLGCGTGEIFTTLASLAPEMEFLGVDFSRASLALASEELQRAKATNARVVLGDLTDPVWGDGSWDVVSGLGSIQHVPDPRVGFANAAAAVRPGGIFLLYFYGHHGRHERRLQQEMLRILVPEPEGFLQRVDLAKRLFAPKRSSGEPLEDNWVADQYAHPRETDYTITQIQDILQEGGLDLVEWLFVSEDPAHHFTDPLVVDTCRKLPRRELLALLDLHLCKVDNLTIARRTVSSTRSDRGAPIG